MSEYLFLTSLLALFLLLPLFYMAIRLRKNRKLSGQKEDSQVSFVVDTFHELIAKLKEKEKELEVLRRRAEERADIIESYNEYILQSVPSGVISFDGNLKITKINAAAEEILGLQKAEVMGKIYNDVFKDSLKDIFDNRTVIGRREVQYTTGAGNNIYLGLALSPLMNADKETIGQLMVFTNITELKALETQMELRNRLSSLGEMAAGMAHELRNPMGVIAGYTKLLSKKSATPSPHIVDSITKEIAVMERIISDFLSFAGPAELNPSEVDLSGLVKECISNIMQGNGIKVFLQTEATHRIQGDEILLRQAFTNLIQNAAEAMQQAGELRLDFSRKANFMEISISDTGYEIPVNIRNKIFLPFYTTKERGTGIGLAIVHKIIMLHHGSITVESSKAGSTFIINLPVTQ